MCTMQIMVWKVNGCIPGVNASPGGSPEEVGLSERGNPNLSQFNPELSQFNPELSQFNPGLSLLNPKL